MKVYLIRHGMTPGNLKHQYIGRTDQPLSEEGRAALAEIRSSGIYPEVEQVFVSPLIRCRESAEVLFPQAAQTVIEELREMDFGIFEERSAADMEEDPVYRAWVEGFCEDPIPEGERKEDFTDRCVKAFRSKMDELEKEETCVFVIHGGTIMAILSEYGRPERGYYDWYIKNGRGYACEWDGEKLTVLQEL